MRQFAKEIGEFSGELRIGNLLGEHSCKAVVVGSPACNVFCMHDS